MKLLNSSISFRISIRVLVFACILFIATLFLIDKITAKMYINEAEESTDFAYQAGCESINGTINEIEAIGKGVTWMISDHFYYHDTLSQIAIDLVKNEHNIKGCRILMVPEYRDQGTCSIYANKENESAPIRLTTTGKDDNNQNNYLVKDYYNITKILKRPTWSEPYNDEDVTKPVSTYSIPLMDKDSNVYSIVCIDISLEWLNKVVDTIQVNDSSSVFITSKGGVFLASNQKDLISKETVFSIAFENEDQKMIDYFYDVFNSQSETRQIFSNESKAIPNVTSDDTYTVLGRLKNGWYMILVTPYSEILVSLRHVHLILVLITIISLIIVCIGISFIVKNETSQLRLFSKVANNIAKGNFDTQLPVIKQKDEIYDLRESLRTMQSKLKTYIKNLQISTAENEKYESELNIAKRIQMSIIPSDFHKEEKYDIYGMSEPAKEVGGDLFDYIIIDNYLYFFIGDVSGKGIPAALYMSFIMSAMNIVSGIKKDVLSTITEINNYMAKYNSYNVFVTLFYGCINLDTLQFEYCNCGHNPIVIKKANKEANFLEAKPNLVLGAFDGFEFQTESIQLHHGDKLILYTDGVTEAERKDFTQYSNAKLIDLCNKISDDMTSQSITEMIYKSVKEFQSGNIQNDDITILTVGVV